MGGRTSLPADPLLQAVQPVADCIMETTEGAPRGAATHPGGSVIGLSGRSAAAAGLGRETR